MKQTTTAFFLSLLLLTSTLSLSFISCTPRDQIVTSVSLGADSIGMEVGETRQLQVIVLPLSATIANTVYWKSSDSRVATVDSKGNVTAVYSGSCYITATCNHITAKCKINVGLLTYTLDFDNAVAYFYGDAYKNQTTNTTLRLFDDGLTLDDDDNIVGAGYFLNLDLIGNDSIPTGAFNVAVDSALPQTFLPGALVERNGIYYAAGSFLGHYTTDGLSVVFIEDGTCTVTSKDDGTYYVEATLIGEDKEEITITYFGSVELKDRTENAPQPEHIAFDMHQASFVALGNIYNNGLQVYRTTINSGNYTLQIECYAPMSSTTLPYGTYTMTGTHESFRIIPSDAAQSSGTLLFDNGTAITISSGSITTNENGIIDCSLRTIDGRFIEYKSTNKHLVEKIIINH
ncbi:MAG: Ig-like domain-containing protein [Bacteroidales bacterium]|nr:Ig-like domain-containing protein [Bacteroidales bacterium]